MICCPPVFVGARGAHYHRCGGRTPIDLKDDTAAEASLRRVTLYLLSWPVPAADPASARDTCEAISAVWRRRPQAADTEPSPNGGPRSQGARGPGEDKAPLHARL